MSIHINKRCVSRVSQTYCLFFSRLLTKRTIRKMEFYYPSCTILLLVQNVFALYFREILSQVYFWGSREKCYKVDETDRFLWSLPKPTKRRNQYAVCLIQKIYHKVGNVCILIQWKTSHLFASGLRSLHHCILLNIFGYRQKLSGIFENARNCECSKPTQLSWRLLTVKQIIRC